jgi:hypothetical protein
MLAVQTNANFAVTHDNDWKAAVVEAGKLYNPCPNALGGLIDGF